MKANGHAHPAGSEKFAEERRSVPRKERPGQGLFAQPAVVRAALGEMLDRNLTYSKIRAALLKEFGVKTSERAICEYRQRRFRKLIEFSRSRQSDGSAGTPDEPSGTVLVIHTAGPVRLEILPGGAR